MEIANKKTAHGIARFSLWSCPIANCLIVGGNRGDVQPAMEIRNRNRKNCALRVGPSKLGCVKPACIEQSRFMEDSAFFRGRKKNQ